MKRRVLRSRALALCWMPLALSLWCAPSSFAQSDLKPDAPLRTVGTSIPVQQGQGVLLGGAPPNDLCSNAAIEPLEAGGSVVRTGDNTGATDEISAGIGQVWEAFTTTECLDVAVAYCGTDPAFQGAFNQLVIGCPLSNLAFTGAPYIDQTNCGDGNYTIVFPELPAGTYYYPVMSGPGSMGPYTITFSGVACTATPPDNDECSGAIVLTPASQCVPVTGDVAGANNGVSLPAITCGGFTGDASDDVWFSFVATSDAHTIVVQGSAEFDATVDLRSGTCGDTESIDCADSSGRGGVETLNATGLTLGQTYYVRVNDWYAGRPLTTTFSICVLGPDADVCEADAGTLSTEDDTVCLEEGSAALAATPNGDSNVPEGFETIYVLTQGEDLLIIDVSADPLFSVTEEGTYTIHTLVFDPETLDLDIVELGTTTGTDVHELLIQGGGDICASLDVIGAAFSVEECEEVCEADAGTLSTEDDTVCLEEGSAALAATPNGDSNVPEGFETIYVLTQGEDLLIIDVSADPLFSVTEEGTYTIHTLVFDPETLDLDIVELGTTTGTDVHELLIQGGGDICASLDVVGAAFSVEECEVTCEAETGTLTPDEGPHCLEGGETTITAIPNGDAVVPEGFEVVYGLSQGEDLLLIDGNDDPSFTVNSPGTYTIHTVVYDPTTLDLGAIEFGETTGNDLNNLLIQGGGSICAALDLAGATFVVEECEVPCEAEAGTLTPDEGPYCPEDGEATITATPNGDSNVPEGFETIYVLTQGEDLLIIDVSADPLFSVTEEGTYTIHTLVFDPETLDLDIVELGTTTGTDVHELLIQGGGDICASLDVDGAVFHVVSCIPENNECSTAALLTIGQTGNCVPVEGDNGFATQNGGEPGCDLSNAGYADVWYTFNAGLNTEVDILLDPGTMTEWALTVLDDCAGDELLCEVQPEGAVTLTTTPGSTYLLRVYSNLQFGVPGTFTLCVTGAEPTIQCDGGSVSISSGGSMTTICQDAAADVVSFTTSSTSSENYTFIVTNEDGIIVTPLAGNALDFNSAALGVYQVWGVSHNGTLEGIAQGADIANLSTTGECLEVSEDFVTVTVEICTGMTEMSGASWHLFPNPGNGDLTLVPAVTEGRALIRIFDIGGRIVHEEQVGLTAGQPHSMPLAGHILPGMYNVRIDAASNTATLRMVVH